MTPAAKHQLKIQAAHNRFVILTETHNKLIEMMDAYRSTTTDDKELWSLRKQIDGQRAKTREWLKAWNAY